MRPYVPPSFNRVWSIYPISFEVGITNFVCGYTLGSHIVFYMSVCESVRPSFNRVWSISPILVEVGITNSVCGYTLGSQIVAYYCGWTITMDFAMDQCLQSDARQSYSLMLIGFSNK